MEGVKVSCCYCKVVLKNLRQLVVVTIAAAILEKLGLSLAYYQLGTSSASAGHQLSLLSAGHRLSLNTYLYIYM